MNFDTDSEVTSYYSYNLSGGYDLPGPETFCAPSAALCDNLIN